MPPLSGRLVSGSVFCGLKGLGVSMYGLLRYLLSPGYDKVIFVTHPADSLDNLGLIVLYDFNPFKLLSGNT